MSECPAKATAPLFVRDSAGHPRCPTCGCLVEEQFEADMIAGIKRGVCEFATYEIGGGCMIPRCGISSHPTEKCPKPDICEDWQPGCTRTDAYQIECGKVAGKPCPRNVCKIRMRDWQMERNAKRLRK